jgi:acetyltransferase-like isoleucine patch superfamily enzyme
MILKRLLLVLYRRFAVRENVTLGTGVHVGFGSILWAPNSLVVGDDVYIGKYCTVECDGSIGSGVMIANQVGLIGRHDHDIRVVGRSVRRSPWIGDPDYGGPGKGLRIVIEDDVWVGYAAVIVTGVRIGRGAVVAAGSVVLDDVEPYSIVAGNPARRVNDRFTGQEIVEHELLLRR